MEQSFTLKTFLFSIAELRIWIIIFLLLTAGFKIFQHFQQNLAFKTIFLKNVLAFNCWFQNLSPTFFLSTAEFMIFNNFLLLTSEKMIFLEKTVRFKILNIFFAFNCWFKIFQQLFCLRFSTIFTGKQFFLKNVFLTGLRFKTISLLSTSG